MSQWNLEHPATCACSQCSYQQFLHDFTKRHRRMGYWRITIDGVGCHHNGERAEEVNDANLRAAQFVEQLTKQGHTIVRAEFALTSQLGPEGTVTRAPEDLLAPQPT